MGLGKILTFNIFLFKTIQLNLAKSYLRQDKGQLAIPLLVSLADQLPDNFGLCVLAVKTMALNGGDLNKVKAILDKMEVTFTGDEEQVQVSQRLQ